MSKRWTRVDRVVLAGLLVLGGLVAKWVWWPGRVFDPGVWKSSAWGGDGARREMAERLIARRTLAGKSRDEAVALLGEPWSRSAVVGGAEMDYMLGWNYTWSGKGHEYLTVRIGGDGRVHGTRIVMK